MKRRIPQVQHVHKKVRAELAAIKLIDTMHREKNGTQYVEIQAIMKAKELQEKQRCH